MDNQVKKLNKWVLIAGLAGGALMTAMLGTAGAAPATETSESTSGHGQEVSKLSHMTATITAGQLTRVRLHEIRSGPTPSPR